MILFTNQYLLTLKVYISTELRSRSTTNQKERGLYFSTMKIIKIPGHKIKFCFTICILEQCFSTAGPRPGTGPWHQLYRAARGSPGICHFSFL